MHHRTCWMTLAAGLALMSLSAAAEKYYIRTTAPMTLTLPVNHPDGEHMLRGADNAWRPAQGEVHGNTATFTISPEDADRDGAVMLLTDKPAWLTLEDHEPPRITEVQVDGNPVQVQDSRVDLGVIAVSDLSLDVTCRDQDNPIDMDGIRVDLPSAPGVTQKLDLDGLDGSTRQGTVTITLQGLKAGRYEAAVTIPDQSVDAHAAHLAVTFTIIGIDIVDNGQAVRMATAAGEYRFQPDRSNQLRLPNGVWAKLTTNIKGTWLYPREIVKVTPVKRTAEGQTVTLITNTQGIKGTPIDDIGVLGYTFTVRSDTPALLVETRSISLIEQPERANANWGWLPGDHYVTAAGKQQWRGKATDSYIRIGNVGWLWLAPTSPDKPGLVWVSPQPFGESRFDTMLLYSEDKPLKKGEYVDIRFAIAPAENAEEAEAIARDLVEKGLIEAPPQ